MNRNHTRFFALACLMVLVTAAASAQTKGTVTFGGLKNLQYVGDYYNGGGPTNLGLPFGANAQAIVQAAKGGSGSFINNPGGYPVMFFQTGSSVVVNVTNGVGVSVWFSYSALKPGGFTVYDGQNGMGNVLANITLNPNNSGCSPYAMCVWTPVAVPLTTSAGSIRFSGTANYIAIGSIHFGQLLTTATTVTTSQNPSQPCASATYTATVLGTAGVVPANSQNGLVNFRAGNKILAKNVPLVNGSASITATLPSGSIVTATFKATASFNTSHGSVTMECLP